MKNIFANLSDQTKGILLIVAGLLLVLNFFGFIEILKSIIAISGLLMIAAGVMLARFHKKIYVLIVGKKYNDQQSDKNVADDMDDPDRGF